MRYRRSQLVLCLNNWHRHARLISDKRRRRHSRRSPFFSSVLSDVTNDRPTTVGYGHILY